MDKWSKYKACDKHRIKTPVSAQNLIEIKRISDDGIFEVGAGGIFTKTYELSDINYSLLSTEEKRNFLEKWEELVNSFVNPFKITVMKKEKDKERVKREVFLPEKGGHMDGLASLFNEEIVGKGVGMDKKIYLTLREDSVKNFPDAAAKFLVEENSISSQFSEIEAYVTPLLTSSRLKLLSDFYRNEAPFSFDITEAARSCRDFLDDISPSKIDFSLNDTYFTTENQEKKKYHSCLYIKDYGNKLTDNFLNRLLSLNLKMTISVDVYPVEDKDAESFLNDKYKALRKLIKKQNKNRVDDLDFSSDTTKSVADDYREINAQIDDFNKGQRYFYTMVHFCITADSLDELKNSCGMLISSAKGAGAEIDYCYLKQKDALNTVLPTGVKMIADGRTLQSRALCTLFPFSAQKIYDEKGMYYGHNPESGDIIMIDRKNLPSPHGWMIAPTGRGKTGEAILEILEILMKTNDDVLVISPKKKDFKAFTEKVKGAYYDISLTSGMNFNPLSCDDNGVNKSEFLLAIVEACKGKTITAEESSIIEQARKLAYEKCPIGTVTLLDIYKFLDDTSSQSIAEKIKLYLERFVTGVLNIFAKPTNVDISKRYTVFGLADMGESLRTVSMLVISEVIKERVYKNFKEGRATWIYIDEAPEILKTDAEQDYFNSIWKLYRAYGAILTGMAQNATDLLKSVKTKEILENSDFVMLFNQKVSSENEFRDFLGLSPAERRFVVNAKGYGKGLIKVGSVTVPFDKEIAKDTELYNLINTNVHEKQKRGKQVGPSEK